MNKLILVACLAALSMPAMAGNDQANPCGNNGNNCNTGGTTNNQGGNGYGGDGGSASGIGIGVGVGLGGQGGQGGAGGGGGDASAIGVGGNGGSVLGSGNANVRNDNHNDATAISGSVSGAESQSDAKASATNGGNTITNGPVTQQGGAVSQRGGDTNVSYRTERNAPPVYLGNVAATVSCAGGFSAGSSSQGGAGALGFNWISPDCKTVVAGQNLQSLGMVDVACRIFKTTDGFKRAAKRDQSLKNVDCSIAK
jgi:hypothetical protein